MAPQNIMQDIIKSTIARLIPDADIYLFGSRARGEYYEDSDFDLLIITKKEYSLMDKALFKYQIQFLILIIFYYFYMIFIFNIKTE